MHPLNPYFEAPPDFALLASKSGRLRDCLQRSAQDGGGVQASSQAIVDFKDAISVRALTEAILEHDFGLHCNLRGDRLCPAIPNRLNYIAWIEELLEQTQEVIRCMRREHGTPTLFDEDEGRPVKRCRMGEGQTDRKRILDIGTGASCIYPLLGCALHDWEFIATDIDKTSLEAASTIVGDPCNGGQSKARLTKGKVLELGCRVHLMLRDVQDRLLPTEEELPRTASDTRSWPFVKEGLLYHVTMCNPPFYSSRQEMQDSAELKEGRPSAICHGSEQEMISEGGEVAFVRRMIEESRSVGSRVIWFTSMVGKLSTIDALVRQLQSDRVDNYLLTEFVQGKTKRWAIAWSHLPFRMGKQSMVPLSAALQRVKGTVTSRWVPLKGQDNIATDKILADLLGRLDKLGIPHRRQTANSIVVTAARDSWSRKARRAQGALSEESKERTEPALCVRLDLLVQSGDVQGRAIEARWLFGRDAQLFEGFVMSVLRGWAEQYSKVA